jgi:hypothetical protein
MKVRLGVFLIVTTAALTASYATATLRAQDPTASAPAPEAAAPAAAALTVAELFDRVRNTMPQDDPQSMNREDTAAVLAYMFTKNGFPSGDSPLPSDGDSLARIKYLANKP